MLSASNNGLELKTSKGRSCSSEASSFDLYKFTFVYLFTPFTTSMLRSSVHPIHQSPEEILEKERKKRI